MCKSSVFPISVHSRTHKNTKPSIHPPIHSLPYRNVTGREVEYTLNKSAVYDKIKNRNLKTITKVFRVFAVALQILSGCIWCVFIFLVMYLEFDWSPLVATVCRLHSNEGKQEKVFNVMWVNQPFKTNVILDLPSTL